MKRLFVLVLAGIVAAGSALAVVDPGTNSMSIYFDTDANIYEGYASPGTTVQMHIVLANPDMPLIWGWECGVQIVGNCTVAPAQLIAPGAVDYGHTHGGFGDLFDVDHKVFFPDPYPTSAATLLATIDILLLDSDAVSLLLQGTTPSLADDPRYPVVLVAEGNDVVTAGVFAWDTAADAPGVCAIINGTGVVPADPVSWGSVKSLFR